MSLPVTVSESTRRLNPHLFSPAKQPVASTDKPRMRQNRGPKMNKTEAAFYAWFKSRFPDLPIYREGVTLLIGNGVRYTPDFAVFNPGGGLVLYETKGFMRDDAAVKIKVAATTFPRAEFWLATACNQSKATWNLERVHP